MPFRTDPLTTAEGVDTGEKTTGPGVRLFQDPNPGGVSRGVLEFRDGVSGDEHATITRTVSGFVDGDLIRSFGGSLTIDGGSMNATDAGGLTFEVIEDPAGGYKPRTRLLGPALAPILGPTPLQIPDTTRFEPYPADTFGWAQPVAWRTADGWVHGRGMLRTKGAGNWAAGQVFCKIPAGFPPPGDRLPITLPAFNDRPARFDLRPDGSLTWEAPMTGDTSYAIGNYVSLNFDYLPPA